MEMAHIEYKKNRLVVFAIDPIFIESLPKYAGRMCKESRWIRFSTMS
jgi:hypothetical protein